MKAPAATVEFSDFTRRFGIAPTLDPVTGLSFYLWDDMFSTTSTGQPLPNFSVQEAAKTFFGKGPDWLRWRYRPANNYPDGYFVLTGLPQGPDHKPVRIVLTPKRNEKGIRYYTLADVERMAHALAQNQAIDGAILANILEIVLNVSRLYEVFTPKEDA